MLQLNVLLNILRGMFSVPSFLPFLLKRKSLLLRLTMLVMGFGLMGSVAGQATVSTDLLDYPPGGTVIISGTGFTPGESVKLQVTHVGAIGDNTSSGAHAPWDVTADANGNISSTWLVPLDEDELGATLLLTADGQTSGLHAEAVFTDASSVTITSSPSGTGNPQTALTICAGTSVTFTAAKNGGSCTPNYQWRKNSIDIAGATSSTYTTSTLTNGDIITVFQSVSTGGCSAALSTNAITVTVVASSPSTPGAITRPTTECAGSVGNTYSISAVSGATSYTWSVTGTGWSVTAGGSTTSATITIGSGIGTVSVTASNTCGTSAASTTGNITPTSAPATPGVITRPATECTGSTGNTYSISAVSGATSYTWSVTGTGWSVTAGGSTTSATITIGSGVGTVSVTATNTCGTSSASTTGNITPTTAPATPGVITRPATECAGSTGNTYSISAVSGAVSYTWSVTGTGWSVTAGGSTTSATITIGSGVGTVSVTATNTCGTSSASTTGNITPTTAPSTPGTITGLANICTDATGVSYSIVAVGGATSYTWSVPSGASITSGQGTNSILVSFGSTSGDISVTASNTCGTSSAQTKAVMVNPLPADFTVGYTGSLCGTATINLSGSEIGVNYALKRNGSTVETLAGTGNSLSFAGVTQTGLYTVVATSPSNCIATMTGSVDMGGGTPPNSTYIVTGGGAYCSGGSGLVVGLSNSETGVNYQLYLNASPVGSPVAGTGAAINFPLQTAAGSYTIQGTKTSGGCTATMTGSVNIVINTAPSITGHPVNQSVTYGASATFTVAATGTGPLTYQWQVDNGGGFSNITLSGIYANTDANDATLEIAKPTVSMSGYKYRCIVTGACSPAAMSDGNATLTVSKASLTVTAVTDSKVYDGTTSSDETPTVSNDLVSGDVINAQPTQLYDNKNVGNTHVMTASGLTIKDGSNADMTGNYNISYVTVSTGVISQKSITVTAVTDSKVYDGTTSSDETPTVSTLAAGDLVNTAAQVYDNKNVGNTHVLNVSVLTIKDGSNVDVTTNYDINFVVSSATGIITVRPITVTAVTNLKVYDGNASAAAVPTFPPLQTGDVVSTHPIEVYNNPFVATGKTMTASGLVINDGNEGNNYSISYVQNFTGEITALAVTTSVSVSPTTKQYSDLVTYNATIVGGAPLVTGGPQAAASATFKVGTQVIGTAPFVVSGSNLVATLSNQPLLEPTPYGTTPTGQMSPGSKTITAVINSPDQNYSIDNLEPTTSLLITKEDVRVNYTGLMFQATPNTSTSTATVLLQASVIDITAAIDDPDYDASAGDIRNARVMFVNRDNANSPLSGWLTPTLLNNADTKSGTVSSNYTFTITGSNNAESFTVGIIVDYNGYYYRDDQDDNTVVTVYKPLGDFVVGGGFIKPTQSSGTYASTSGLKTNFGLNVKYNKKGTNLQGSVNIIFRRNIAGVIRTYQIKTNSMTSLGVGGTTANRKAQFLSKANLRDITNPLYPISLGGNLDLRVDMVDLGEPGNRDSIGVTLYDGGTLLYSSNWIVSKTVPMVLTGGNIQINGANFGPAIRVEGPDPTAPIVVLAPQEFNVKVFGNPSLTSFRIKLEGTAMNEKITIKVVDMNGRMIEMKQNLYPGQVIELGSAYRQGTYFAEVTQGDQRKVVKLIKIGQD